MYIEEKRKHPRVNTNNSVSYVIIDDSGNEIAEGLGKIINVSTGGFLLETTKPIGLNNISITVTDIDDEKINIKGNVTNCRMEDSETFRCGVQFLKSKEDTQLFVTNLIKFDNKQTRTSHDFIKIS